MMEQIGKMMILAGLLIAVVGILFMLGGKLPFFGKLPGDIAIHRENVSFYFPLTTSIAISILLTLVFWLISYFRN